MPFTSAEQEPHLPALQFQRQARSLAWFAWISCDRVEHDHAFGDAGRVISERTAAWHRRARS